MKIISNKILIAGPCSIESPEQLEIIANSVKKSGATILRGGAYKPRTNPDSFQGHGEKALIWLYNTGKKIGMPVVSEILDVRDLPLFLKYVDIIQIGSRNMQNYPLLKELGLCKKTVLLKRGCSATYEEFFLSSEYIRKGGNSDIILCERGIRTFSNSKESVRNTLDVSAIPIMKSMVAYPIIVDPSHSSGRSDLVLPLSKAAMAVGADGLMVEVHNNPEKALSDGKQSLNLNQFQDLCQNLHQVHL